MKLTLSNNKDFLTGALLIGFGAVGMYMAMDYPFGSALRMGPGYFPRVLSGIMLAFGLYKELVSGVWGWKPLVMITIAFWLYGWLMDHVGMVPSLAVLLFVSAAAGHEFKWLEVTLLTIFLILFAYGVFIYGLGLPYKMFWWD
jgi:hypothetical protein